MRQTSAALLSDVGNGVLLIPFRDLGMFHACVIALHDPGVDIKGILRNKLENAALERENDRNKDDISDGDIGAKEPRAFSADRFEPFLDAASIARKILLSELHSVLAEDVLVVTAIAEDLRLQVMHGIDDLVDLERLQRALRVGVGELADVAKQGHRLRGHLPVDLHGWEGLVGEG